MTETAAQPAPPRAPENWFTVLPHYVGAVLIVIMMLHISADVAARWFFGVSIVGTLEYVSYIYMVSVVFLPLGRVQQERGHVLVEVISNLFPPKVTEWVDRGALLFSFGYVSFIGWWGWQEAVRSFRRNEILPLIDTDLPLWPSRFVVPIGLAAMAVVILFQLVRSLRGHEAAAPSGHGRH